MENDLMLDEEPFVGYMPHDVRAWVQEHHLESELACAMMIVHNRVGVLMHLCDESSDPWVDYAFEAWHDIETELAARIREILADENRTKGTAHTLDGIGTYYMVKPFMERNGYRDGAGWWIRTGCEM